jgi:hypothetical protein
MVLASLARKIHTPLHGFFHPAKKPMHFSHSFSLFGLKSQCTFVWFFSSGEKTHAVFAWFWPLWLEKLIHLCMGFFIRHKNPCTFCMVLASLAQKIHTPLHGFFRPAKKTMHFSHSFSLFG